ncbi:hypothetical protein HDU97_008767 [Phlyctochytrium planicorne]|nr:hypothetical protein HDU97_008767 [Phlyctochytrium planicorne]
MARRLFEMAAFIRSTFEPIVFGLAGKSELTVNIQVVQIDGGILHTAINAVTLALIDAGIQMTDYVVACSAGYADNSAILDLNFVEESRDVPVLTVACLAKSQKILLATLESRLHLDHFEQVMRLAQAGSMEVLEILQRVIVLAADITLFCKCFCAPNVTISKVPKCTSCTKAFCLESKVCFLPPKTDNTSISPTPSPNLSPRTRIFEDDGKTFLKNRKDEEGPVQIPLPTTQPDDDWVASCFQSIFPAHPSTTRGHSISLGEDPKGVNFLYTTGRSVIIRNIENPLIATEYNGHSFPATVAKYSPSGFYIASGDAQGNIRIWDTTQAENILKTETRALSGRVNDLSWDFESKRLIAVGEGKDRFGHAFLFDSASSVGEISGHSKTINAVSIRPGRPLRAVTCSDDMTVNFYHGVPFKFNKTIRDHTRFVQCAKFSPNGDYFATCGMDAKIFLYDGKTGDLISEVSGSNAGHSGGILSLSWNAESTSLLSCSMDMTAKIWDVSRKEVVNTFTLGDSIDDQQVGCLWQGKNLLSVSLSGDINYLDPTSQKVSRSLKGHQKGVTALSLVSSNTFVSGSYDGRVLAWDENTGSKSLSGIGHSNQVTQILKTDSKLLSIGMDDTLRAIDIDSLSYDLFQLKIGSLPKGIVSHGDLSIVISGDQIIRLVSKGSLINNIKVNWTPTAIAISPKGDQIAIGDEDRNVHIFSLKNIQLEEIKVVTQNRGLITVLAYSPDGTLLASADKERMILVFSVADWTIKINSWLFHNARINCFAWSPDGKYATSGSLDTNVEIWSVEKPTKHVTIKGAHLESVNCVEFLGPNTVVSAGQDGSIKIWNFSPF